MKLPAKLPLRRFEGVAFRVTGVALAREALGGVGSERFGARFTPAGEGIKMVYVAEAFITAFKEAGLWNANRLKPTAILSLELRLDSVLDLTVVRNLEALGLTFGALECDWVSLVLRGRDPITQRLGRALFLRGDVQAIRFRSTKGSGCNLAVFVDRVGPGQMAVFDPEGALEG